MLETIQRHDKVVISSCNTAGESYALARYVAWFLVAFDDTSAAGVVLVTSISQRQVEQSAIFYELRQIVNAHDIDYPYQPKKSLMLTKLQMPNGAYASGGVATLGGSV